MRNKNLLSKIIDESFSSLSPRYKEILKERYGLKDGHYSSLQEIGTKRKITRERVRQIINLALRKVKIPKSFNSYSSWATRQLKLWGGIESEELFFKEARIHFFLESKDAKGLFSEKLKFLLVVSDKINFYAGGGVFKNRNKTSFKNFFYLNEKSFEKFKNITSDFQKVIKLKGGILEIKEFSQTVSRLSKKYKITEGVVCSYLAILKNIEVNILGEVGFDNLNRIRPRSVRDRLHLIFRKVGEPLHYSQAVQVFKDNDYWQKAVNIHTVHNELIKDERFVLIGRGVYALKEWGYLGGTVKDVLERVLGEAKKPLSFKEIMKAVSRELKVKEETVKFNLKKYPQFQALDNSKYTLKKKLKILKA